MATRRYVALGDSMSIDDYTGVSGGGAAHQFHRSLGAGWTLADFTRDGCTIRQVPTNQSGDLITLTIGGNDLLEQLGVLLATTEPLDAVERASALRTLDEVGEAHLDLLRKLRAANPDSILVVANIYEPAIGLPGDLRVLLRAANDRLLRNIEAVGARLADIHAAFAGRAGEFLCMDIEPTHEGATEIARLFRAAAQP